METAGNKEENSVQLLLIFLEYYCMITDDSKNTYDSFSMIESV